MAAIKRIYPRIANESTDLSYQAAFDLASADTAALVASTSMYSVPVGLTTYSQFRTMVSTYASGSKPGWVKGAIGGIVYRFPILADS